MRYKIFLTLSFLIVSLLTIGQSADGSFRTVTASGGPVTYTISDPLPASYDSKEKWLVTFSTPNSGAATLNRNGLGAKDIKTATGSALTGGELTGRVMLSYNGTYFQVVGGSGAGGVSGSGTTNELTYWTGASALGALTTATYPSLTELSYVKGVTSAIQTQIDGKQPLDSDLTSWAAVTRASGFDTWVTTPSSANLRSLLTDETGTGLAYFQGGALGTPSSGTATNLTGLPVTGLTGTWANLVATLTGTAPYWDTTTGGTSLGTNTWNLNHPWVQNFNVTAGTGATAGINGVFNALTTGDGVSYGSSSLTSGVIVKVASTSTAINHTAGTNSVGWFETSGANANVGRTAIALSGKATNTNVTSGTNIGVYASASGATTANYAFYGEGGVNTSPVAHFTKADNASGHVPIVSIRNTSASGSAFSVLSLFNSNGTGGSSNGLSLTLTNSTNAFGANSGWLINRESGGALIFGTSGIFRQTISSTGLFTFSPTTLGSGTGVDISAVTTDAASNTQTLTKKSYSGANATSTQTTRTDWNINGHTGTSSTNYASYNEALNGTVNIAGYFSAPLSSGNLSINLIGALGLNSSAGTSGQVLTSAGAGATPTWSSIAPGITVGSTVITSGTDTRVPYNDGGIYGEDASFSWNETDNILTVGSTRIFNKGGGAILNTYYGQLSGNTTSTTASANIGMGVSALPAITTGSNNIALGYQSQLLIQDGDANISLGASLGSNVSGDGNVALGHLSLGSVTASNNTGVGLSAGDNITSGSNNLILGANIDAPSATVDNQLSIQNIIFGTGNSGTGTTVSTGSIGIGTNAPDRRFHVETSDAVTNAVTISQRNSHTSSGTVAAGFGDGREVELENASGTMVVASKEETVLTDATNATEDADKKFYTVRAGALTEALTITSTGNLYGTALHNNSVAPTGTVNQYITSGTHTPTVASFTNVAASTAYECHWTRVGNEVTFMGTVDIDPTAPGLTQLSITLDDIPSNFAATTDAAGTAVTAEVAGHSGVISANVANDYILLEFTAVDVSNRKWQFSCKYEVK